MAKVIIKEIGATLSRYIVFDPDRHENPRYYFRKKGHKKVRLHAEPGSRAFLDEFDKAFAACREVAPVKPTLSQDAENPRRNAPKGSLAWLFNEYERRSKAFRDLDETTKARRRTVMDQICAEPTSIDPPDPSPLGLRGFKNMTLRVLNLICDRCTTPDTANARVKALRQVMKFATEEELRQDGNPARDLGYRKSASEGYHTWTVSEVEQYEARWSVGTVQRLALGVLAFTGQRPSDASALAKQFRKTIKVQVNGITQEVPGWEFTQFKGRKKQPVRIWIPTLAPLQVLIDATASKGLTYLETSFGNPFTRKGFQTQFKKWCVEAGLPHCSAHGVRKAAATVAAERGATPYQLMAIFGWRTLTQALGYTKAAEQKRLAAASMHLLDGDKSVSLI
ncbi:MAG: site-specific integrase [Pseudomonadota bacterium]